MFAAPSTRSSRTTRRSASCTRPRSWPATTGAGAGAVPHRARGDPWGDDGTSPPTSTSARPRAGALRRVHPRVRHDQGDVPVPLGNHAHQRGMHIISVDGPGQGENNLAGTRLTADNYGGAMSAVFDCLETRTRSTSKIGLYGMSFGSLWAFQAAAADPARRRWRAVGAFDRRQVPHVQRGVAPPQAAFAYLTGARPRRSSTRSPRTWPGDDLAARSPCPRSSPSASTTPGAP